MGQVSQPVHVGPRINEALYATGTPAELRAIGHDLRRVHSCAIPNPEGGIRGCAHAVECSLRMFGMQDEGGFGPQNDLPGTPGLGPKYVGYYLETVEGDAKEDFIRCSAWMTALYNRYQDQEKTGETLLVVAQEGEPIEIVETVPVEPRTCNKSNNVALVSETKQILVPEHPRPADIDRRSKFRQNAKTARRERMLNRRRVRAGFDDVPADEDARISPRTTEKAVAKPVGRPRGSKNRVPAARPVDPAEGSGGTE